MATGPGMGSGCPRVGNDVQIGYLLSMTLVAETFEMPRVRVRRFRACHRKRALWKKSRVDRRVGGDPVNGKDEDGRFFGIDSWVAGFAHKLIQTGNPIKAWNAGNHQAYMDAKIWGGLFQGTPGDFLSRLTYELPQTVVGLTFTLTENIFGNVRDVDYYRQATMVETRSKNWGGITIGTYITVQSGTDIKSPLFMHEYGHVLQSNILGPLYLPAVGLTSIGNAAGWWGGEHTEFWTEKWADNLSERHFGKEKYSHEKFTGATNDSPSESSSISMARNEAEERSMQDETDCKSRDVQSTCRKEQAWQNIIGY